MNIEDITLNNVILNKTYQDVSQAFNGNIQELGDEYKVKMISSINSKTLMLSEIKESIASESIQETISRAWENLQAVRQNIIDGNEELIEEISEGKINKMIITVAKEGEVDQDSLQEIGKKLRNGNTLFTDWEIDLQDKVEAAVRLHGLEDYFLKKERTR